LDWRSFYFFGSILSVILIGWFLLLLWVVWLIVRSVKGMKALDEEEAIDNPTSCFFKSQIICSIRKNNNWPSLHDYSRLLFTT